MTPEERETYFALLYAGKIEEAKKYRAAIDERTWNELGESEE